MKYVINWSRAVSWLLPVDSRKPTIAATIYALLAPIRAMHANFLGLTEQANAYKYNCQKLSIEKGLNDTFGQGIFITLNTPSATADGIGDFTGSEFYLGLSYLAANTHQGSVEDFAVKVPAYLSSELPRIVAFVEKYKTAQTTFITETY